MLLSRSKIKALMKLKHLYLAIAIVGTIVPYYFFIGFLMEHGLNLNLMLDQMFVNGISSFFSWDVIISTFAVVTLVISEGKKLEMKHRWLYIIFNLSVGVSLALPAFLYARELKIENN